MQSAQADRDAWAQGGAWSTNLAVLVWPAVSVAAGGLCDQRLSRLLGTGAALQRQEARVPRRMLANKPRRAIVNCLDGQVRQRQQILLGCLGRVAATPSFERQPKRLLREKNKKKYRKNCRVGWLVDRSTLRY